MIHYDIMIKGVVSDFFQNMEVNAELPDIPFFFLASVFRKFEFYQHPRPARVYPTCCKRPLLPLQSAQTV